MRPSGPGGQSLRLTAVVERQLERKVIAFMSQNHIDPSAGLNEAALLSES